MRTPETSLLRDQHLAQLREGLARAAYPGYPSQENRLITPVDDLARNNKGRLIIPDGPWHMDRYNARNLEAAPKFRVWQALGRAGLELDASHRPLHPWFKEMIEDPGIGVVTGKGAYWNWGPNPTADGIIEQNGHFLLVKRKDTGKWAFPGGYLNKRENPIDAARREPKEETGIIIPKHLPYTVLYRGPLADTRVTAHAWPETTAVLFRLGNDGPLPIVRGLDDAKDARWFTAEQMKQLEMHGSHRLLGNLALKEIQKP